tara:strand:+ start:178 stop:336 length:159 start_codon:yes stop_codon:yes gene_type:complete
VFVHHANEAFQNVTGPLNTRPNGVLINAVAMVDVTKMADREERRYQEDLDAD